MKSKIVFTIATLLCAALSVSSAAAQRSAKKPASAVKADSAKAAAKPTGDRKKEIDAFNEELKQSILSMDNARIMALWDEDGTDLLPGQEAVTGKANISKWLYGVTDKMKGWKVVSQDNEFHDIQINGDWASEWATTVQVSQPPEGKKIVGIMKKHEPVKAKGKMLL